LDARKNNFLCALHHEKGRFGLAFLDISTGEFFVAEGLADAADKLLQSLSPTEVLINKKFRNEFAQIFGEAWYHYALDEWVFGADYANEKLSGHFHTKSLKGFGVEDLSLGIIAAGACLHYLEATHHDAIGHITGLARLDQGNYVWLDRFTIRNLELVSTAQEGGTSLLDVLDRNITPMGSRLLRKWVLMPLREKEAIERRLDMVQALVEDTGLANQLSENLKEIGDMERLVSKIALNRANPRELLQLKKSLQALGPIKTLLSKEKKSSLQSLAEQLNPCESLLAKLEAELNEDAPISLGKGEVIKGGIHPDLDELRAIAFNSKDVLASIQKRESERTGISSLKIAFNNVFGYYLEVTNVHKDKVPAEWIRKQTLVNAERYITEELKTYEEKIMGAEDKIAVIESRLYHELLSFANEFISALQLNAQVLARIDCLHTFSVLARDYQYHRPEITEEYELSLLECRHPVIERKLKTGESYIPNDLYLNNSSQQLIILTGPNMSGKSAILRQTALAVIMAQMGCFVPAKKAVIGLVDKVFTRVGASDNLSGGESTFMVEMMETASILNNLSQRSLILLDEIGRGTSTYDGVSLAWSISEFIATHEQKPKTMFATHYHELNELEAKMEGVVNYHVAVKETDGNILFLRKMKPGGSEHSFGIHVARMAGVPSKVLSRAEAILHRLEADRSEISGRKTLKKVADTIQLQMFQMEDPKLKEVIQHLQAVDVNTLTPIEALMKLNEVKLLLE
ncbi:MAG: DNA mismatch repair protein MutS, partial [Bacteroidota bacterium]|nr:DNA mismatch repair protein MutS [Bacteroidota bacterium]MDX5430820.1 DNA mismatch repair protein MutS [Bacteroidota bacterium]MDX5469566.1 DNA mismatch repair protein MutS [Bacteroidota bacterium]